MPRNTEEAGTIIQGLDAMQRVLKKGETGIGPELKKRLGEAGKTIVAPRARSYAPRGKRPNKLPRLNTTIRSGVLQKGAEVYATSVYGGVQNFGGKVGRDHATILPRAKASQYMTRAVRDTQEPVARHVEGTLDWLQRELGR